MGVNISKCLKAGVPGPEKTGRFLGGGGWRGESNPLGSGLMAPPSFNRWEVETYTTKTYTHVLHVVILNPVSSTAETWPLEQWTNQKLL